jgi:hypothetical protein
LTSKTTFWWLYNTNRLPAAADATFWWLYNTNRLLAGTAITDPLVVRNIERFILGFEADQKSQQVASTSHCTLAKIVQDELLL